MIHQLNARKLLQFKHKKYSDLLIVLILLLLSFSVVDESFLLLPIGSFLLLWAIFLMLKQFYLPNHLLHLLRYIAILAFILDVLHLPEHPGLDDSLNMIANLAYAAFLGITIMLMSKRIFSEEIIGNDTVVGGICIYLMIGLIWYILYSTITIVDRQAFNITHRNIASPSQGLLYFSFTTLTTLGYGDILPINRFAMTLTSLEAIVGQMFPAIFIARLVGLYSNEEHIKRQQLKDQHSLGDDNEEDHS